MSFVEMAPAVAALCAVGFGLYCAAPSRAAAKSSWLPAAIVSFLFFVFSFYAGYKEGATGFWPEHSRNLWGNQIWFDLLICASVAIYLLIPRARAVHIKPLPWVLLSYTTGGIGVLLFLAMVLRKEALNDEATRLG